MDSVTRGLHASEDHLPNSARDARRQVTEPPVESFTAGVEARRTLDGILREEDIGESLHGPDRVVRFPRFMIEMFAKMDPAKVATILALASLEQHELAALIRLARREADRTVFHRIWSTTWKAGLAIAIPVYGFAKWGLEQIPFLKELYNLVKGH
ncbi:hypothetical protein MKK88_20515 [Methylobacterium sp. E-005]|uniref:hypothetical protein n=1 Tax=Methylobacterium sp. E-005 TaxID=2836549 RepID=UPI001FBA44EF|nr:hypothetical protein [Methylobacterium sp. E-005]MCJ2088350.1 hypothetical protein [Methylobacterium sp. E-005]